MYCCTQCRRPIDTSATNEAQRYRHGKTGHIFCTKACGMTHRESRRSPEWAPPKVARPQVPCTVCNAPQADLSGHRLAQWRKTGRAYCSVTCSTAYRSWVSSATAAETNRKHAAARMTANNPMHDSAARERMTQTLKRIGHRPPERGGNGRPVPMPELILTALLSSEGFAPQLAIKTGRPKGTGYPPSYKVDAGNPVLKIAVEADGASHAGRRRALDQKRDECLRGLGWTVLRFSNAVILTSPQEIMSSILKSRGCTPTLPRA